MTKTMPEKDAEYYQEHRDDEEEWGEPLEPRSERRRLASMISVRFTPEEAEQIRKAAAQADSSVSDFIRQSTLLALHNSRTAAMSVEIQGDTITSATTTGQSHTRSMERSRTLLPTG